MVIYQDYFLPTMLVAVEIALDFLVNRKFNAKAVIPCVIDLPKSILLLSIGFIITYTCKSYDESHSTTGVVLLLSSFFLSLIVYALCDYTFDKYAKLANTRISSLKCCLPLVASFVFSLVLSVLFYFKSVTLCLGGATL